MYRISEKIANKNNCLALVNGESIGQVASQTLNSMQVINEVVKIPVLRPVLCLDKLEIIDIADRIDTYEISIRPHEDCCTIFTPKAPATKPKLYKAEIFESGFDFETLIDECVETAEIITVDHNLVVPGAKNAIDQMKYEIANEFGVNLGPDTTARDNGSVGGEITKRLVAMGQAQMSSSNKYNQSK